MIDLLFNEYIIIIEKYSLEILIDFFEYIRAIKS
jgi:hypothetical protein